MNPFTVITITALIAYPSFGWGHSFTGRVDRIIDGDTIIVRASLPPDLRSHPGEVGSSPSRVTAKLSAKTNVQLHRVRLAEIDAPELKEAGGKESKRALSEMILHKEVIIIWAHRGRYRRIIGQVYSEGTHVNHELLCKGHAVPYCR